MSKLSMSVEHYMRAPLHVIRDTANLNVLHHRFIKLDVSSLPVVDAGGALVGVVTRTDLLRYGFQQYRYLADAPLLNIPAIEIRDAMTPVVRTVAPGDALATAARLMIEHKIHQVYVVASNALAGVLSARSVLSAVSDLRLKTPAASFMSTPLLVIALSEHIGNATRLLEQAGVTGVVVLGPAGPMGVFTQAEALQCRNLPMSTPVEDAMDSQILTISSSTPMYRAAEEAAFLHSRRVVVCDDHGVRGILTPLDFVRAAQEHSPGV